MRGKEGRGEKKRVPKNQKKRGGCFLALVGVQVVLAISSSFPFPVSFGGLCAGLFCGKWTLGGVLFGKLQEGVPIFCKASVSILPNPCHMFCKASPTRRPLTSPPKQKNKNKAQPHPPPPKKQQQTPPPSLFDCAAADAQLVPHVEHHALERGALAGQGLRRPGARSRKREEAGQKKPGKNHQKKERQEEKNKLVGMERKLGTDLPNALLNSDGPKKSEKHREKLGGFVFPKEETAWSVCATAQPKPAQESFCRSPTCLSDQFM